jgi:hypothetical protein
MRTLVLFAVLTILFSCNDIKSKENIKEDGIVLPAIPKELKMKLLKECRFIDYIMHQLPISVSQSEEQAVMANVLFIDDTTPSSIPSTCKPIGRKFYQYADGSSVEADLYFSTGCVFYVFIEGGQPKYASNITDKGKNFYSQIVQVGFQGQPQ